MLNNLPSILDIHEIYDLKGSIIGRISSIDFPLRRLKALKDLDFESFYPYGIRIPYEIYRRLKITIESDIFHLKKLMITDFSLMLGVHQLDEDFDNKKKNEKHFRLELKPQLGISSLFLATNIDRTILQSINLKDTKEKLNITNKFLMKPLNLIDYPQAITFEYSSMANSLLGLLNISYKLSNIYLLGIPGVTHDGSRVLLYPAFIDCLQTYDNFKHIQHVLQNIRDRKRSTEYSVIHPDEYEKRLIRFLFDKVFIDSKQTLNELFSDSYKSFSNIHNEDQSEIFQPNNEEIFIESTSL
jgi:1-phosphatidylinositol-4-phosphate 5-kinase